VSTDPHYVWWLNQPQTEAVLEPSNFDRLPAYLQGEVKSREGRAGRGRLWVSRTLGEGEFGIDPWPDTALAKELGMDSGGIVFKADDLPLLSAMPGIVTDMKLNKV
jgi:hypothetical protein